MSRVCNDCDGPLTFDSHLLTGQSLESCAKCGYHGPLRKYVPKPIVFTDEDRALEVSEYRTRTCTCKHCGGTFQARKVKPRQWCSEDCRSAWRRLHVHRTGNKPGRKRVAARCPRCGANRVRSNPRPTHPLGIWRCHPCERKAYHARKKRQMDRQAKSA